MESLLRCQAAVAHRIASLIMTGDRECASTGSRAILHSGLRGQGLSAFAPAKYTVLCEKHFLASDFVRTTSYTDEKTGEVIDVPLKLSRLKPTAIPTVFPNCPKYISRPVPPGREAPLEMKPRLEAESLRKAMELSLAAQEEEDKKNKIGSFQQLCDTLRDFTSSEFWTVVRKESRVFSWTWMLTMPLLCVLL